MTLSSREWGSYVSPGIICHFLLILSAKYCDIDINNHVNFCELSVNISKIGLLINILQACLSIQEKINQNISFYSNTQTSTSA